MRLHIRIFALVLCLLMGLGSTNLVFLYDSTREKVKTDVADQLVLARDTFLEAFENREQQLASSVGTVVNDWALRQAIGTQDAATTRSVLINHSRRVEADIALFISKDLTIFASTLPDAGSLPDTILRRVQQTGSNHLFVSIRERHYELILERVHAPVFMGWLAMGFLLDDPLANQFGQLIDAEVSFGKLRGGELHLIASSLDAQALARTIATDRPVSDEIIASSGRNFDDLILHQQLDPSQGDLRVVLQKSLLEPLARFHSWWWSLLTIFMLIAGLALVAAYGFSRSVTRPLNQLIKAVQDMESGDYSTAVEVHRRDEIGSLADSFSKMQRAIADREDEIRYRAEHDPTTATYNRNGFLDALSRALDSARAENFMVVVTCLRINHFQQIVDALGHGWSDRLLKLVAERLNEAFPEASLAHLNSDEFFLHFPTGDMAAVLSLSERVHGCLAGEFDVRGISLTLTSRIGISVYPDHATDGQTLLRRSSVALNEAIERHRRTVIYDPDFDQNSVTQLTLMSELPKAIKRKELDLHYQPKIRCDGDNSRVEGVECLVRWQHPELGFIPPDEFIGLAEKTGYIVELTQYVLARAVAQAAEWRKRNLQLAVAVNISAVDLQQSDFAGRVEALLKKYGLPAGSLCLEVTESAAMEDPTTALARLTTLQGLGVRLSIDDFGTGYSSLAQLKKLPVQELKIDKSFVQELDRSEEDQTIVRSTIELAHNIGLAVVAEGVESSRILWQLEQWQADYVQGYHISRPLSLDDLEAWFEASEFEMTPVLAEQRPVRITG